MSRGAAASGFGAFACVRFNKKNRANGNRRRAVKTNLRSRQLSKIRKRLPGMNGATSPPLKPIEASVAKAESESNRGR